MVPLPESRVNLAIIFRQCTASFAEYQVRVVGSAFAVAPGQIRAYNARHDLETRASR